MRSSSSSPSPEVRRKHKHKHRSRSRSPRDRHSHKSKRKQGHHHEYNDQGRSHSGERKRSKHHHRDRGSDEDVRSHHVRIKQEMEDQSFPRPSKRPIKREMHSKDGMERQRQERSHHNERRQQRRQNQSGNPFSEQEGQFGGNARLEEDPNEGEQPTEKEKPNFELSGKLTEETNMFRGVVIKYSEPPEARKPKKRWRLYPFKEGEALRIFHIHRQSAYLIGRDRKVVDIPVDHPSCSKQHAAFQYRLVPYQRPNGTKGHAVRPYIIDLGSTNGTHVNNTRIEAQRYVELMEKDVLKFGFSSREYVLLHDSSSTDEINDEGEAS